MTKVRWYIVFFLSLGGAINYLDRSAFAIAAPMFAKELALTPSQLGLVFSSFSIGYAVFNLAGGYAADRWGPKLVLSVSMACWSTFCALIGVATGFISMVVIRILFGAGEGPFSTTVNKMINNWFPKREVASAIGMATVGNPLGGAIAGPAVGMLAITFGWRVSFFIIALLGFVWLLGWRGIATDKPQEHPTIDADELDYIRKYQSQDQVFAGASLPLSFYLKQPTILATAFAFFGLNYILFFFMSWFPSFLSSTQHLDLKEMSIVSTIPWLLGCLGMGLGGFLCDHIMRKTGKPLLSRKIVLVSCLGSAAVFVALSGSAQSAAQAVVMMACGLFFMYLSATTYWAILQDTVAQGNIGMVGGLVHALANIAGILGPAITGYLIEWTGSYHSAFFLAAGIAIGGALSVAFFVKPLEFTTQE